MSQAKIAVLSSLTLAVRSLCGDKHAAAAALQRELTAGVANVLKHGNDKPLKEAAAAALTMKGSTAEIIAPMLVELLQLRKDKDATFDASDVAAAEKIVAFMETLSGAMAAAAAAKKEESAVKKAEKEEKEQAAAAAAAEKIEADHAEELARAVAGYKVNMADVLAFIRMAAAAEVSTIVQAAAAAAADWADIEAVQKQNAAAAAAASVDALATAAALDAAAAASNKTTIAKKGKRLVQSQTAIA